MLKLNKTDLLQNNKFRTSREHLEHIATGWDKKDFFYINVKFWWKNSCHNWMFQWVGVFLAKIPLDGTFLLQLHGCWLNFQLRFHVVKFCISTILSELLGDWEIPSGTLKTIIAMVKLIFLRINGICNSVTIHSLLRQQNLI